jgi:hypothetical protein
MYIKAMIILVWLKTINTNMASNIPYMSVPGTLTRILEKIKTAGTPENFNQDFLSNTLGFKGGNYKTFIPWAKKIGFINSDGTPSQLYKKFRNPATSQSSLGEALQKGYLDLYLRNENLHTLDKKSLKGLVMEATGEPHDSKVLELMVNTFWNAKALAEFNDSGKEEQEQRQEETPDKSLELKPEESHGKKVNIGLNYTINLVLPKTDDPAVFNAIFKSLRENLLKN